MGEFLAFILVVMLLTLFLAVCSRGINININYNYPEEKSEKEAEPAKTTNIGFKEDDQETLMGAARSIQELFLSDDQLVEEDK